MVAGREVLLASPGDAGFRAEPDGGFVAARAAYQARVAGSVARLARGDGFIELETTAISRDGDALAIDAATGSLEADGRVAIDRGDVIEHFGTGEAGVEQSWEFATPPGEDGDLVVEVAILGQEYVTATVGGLHFAGRGVRFRYSHAVWVGADGAESPVRATYDGGAIRMVVPAEVVAATEFPAVLDPTIEPEVEVDVPVLGGIGNPASGPSVAWDGSQYLAVWRDSRSGNWAVRASRIAADGTVLDPTGILLSAPAERSGTAVSVTAMGGYFLVVWDEQVSRNVQLTRVDPDGTVTQLGSTGVAGVASTYPGVASISSEALVIFMTGSQVWAVRYAAGVIGAPTPVATSSWRPPSVAASGGKYLVTWTTNAYQARARLVDSSGIPESEIGLDVAGVQQWDPVATFANDQFLVLWTRWDGSMNQVRGSRMTELGFVLAQDIPVSSGLAPAAGPTLSCASGTCLVIWSSGSDFDLTGVTVDPDTLTPTSAEHPVAQYPGTQNLPVVANGGGSSFVVWQDYRDVELQVYGRLVTPEATGFQLGATSLLARDTNRHRGGAVATGASSWLVGWSDSRTGGWDLLGKRYRFTGLPLDTAPWTLNGSSGPQQGASLGWTGSRFVASWIDQRPGLPQTIRAARIEASGTVLDPDGVEISGESYLAEVAGGGGGAVVVWNRYSQEAFTYGVACTAFRADGTTSAAVPLSSLDVDAFHAATAYDSNTATYLVVWAENDWDPVPYSAIRATRVTSECAPLDEISIPAISAGQVDVVYGGGQFFLAWSDNRNAPTAMDLYGARLRLVGGALEVLDPGGVEISTAPFFQGSPSVTFAAKSYLVAWHDQRNLSTTGLDIYGRQVTTAGALYGDELALSTAPGDELEPDFAGSGQRALLVYARNSADFSQTRVYARRVLALAPEGATCTAAGQCQSGYCSDGRCCDSACGGGVTSDCQACSVKRGAAVDGVCGPVAAGGICRYAADTFCDRREVCDGTSLACPDDLGRRQGQVCDADCGAVCPLNSPLGSPHVCPTCP